MTKKEREELKQDLDLLTKEELIEILLDHEEITGSWFFKHEEKRSK